MLRASTHDHTGSSYFWLHRIQMQTTVLLQVDLSAQVPPIEKMDAALSTLKACQCALLHTMR